MEFDEGAIRDHPITWAADRLDGIHALRRILTSWTEDRNEMRRGLMSVPAPPGKEVLAELIAICDQEEVVRLTVLRGIRDAIGGKQ